MVPAHWPIVYAFDVHLLNTYAATFSMQLELLSRLHHRISSGEHS